MYTAQKTAASKLLAITMAIVMALTMTVSAFASDAQPYNADATKVTALVNAGAQTYSVTVTAPSDATKIKFDTVSKAADWTQGDQFYECQCQRTYMRQKPKC